MQLPQGKDVAGEKREERRDGGGGDEGEWALLHFLTLYASVSFIYKAFLIAVVSY